MSTIMQQNKTVEIWSEMYFAKTVIILVSGKAFSGKSTFSKFLCNYLNDLGYVSIISPFAREVKNCAREYFLWNDEKDEKGRKLLQGIGNLGREYDKDIWVIHTVANIENNHPYVDFVIVDDWRYPNEAKYFENRDLYQVFKLRVLSNRKTINKEELRNDSSETSLDNYNDFDSTIYNTGSIEDLENTAKQFADRILEIKRGE